jgi:hypothetical protein
VISVLILLSMDQFLKGREPSTSRDEENQRKKEQKIQ